MASLNTLMEFGAACSAPLFNATFIESPYLPRPDRASEDMPKAVLKRLCAGVGRALMAFEKEFILPSTVLTVSGTIISTSAFPK